MKFFDGLIITLILLVATSCSESSEPTSNLDEDPIEEINYTPTEEFDLTASGYTNFNLSGFNILVEDNVIENNPSLANSVLSIIEEDLEKILTFSLTQEVKNKLLAVPIFIDYNTTNGGAVYHPSETWLNQNGYIPQKAKSVEISNINNFIDWTRQNQPYMLFHELAHAFHHQEYGYSNSAITNAFNNAVSSGLYKNVEYHNGGNNYSTADEAYALTNEKEYFAELSEAYFGRNDYYPFERDELKTYDPEGYSMLQSVWKLD